LGLNNENLHELLKRNRYSALIDGICMGIGFIFIVLGMAIPTVLGFHEQAINGLLAIIGGILVTTIGGVMEVYHWARLPLVRSQESGEERSSGLFLRCVKCGRKTAHVLINAPNSEKGEMKETFQCLQCGEIKKIYEPASAEISAPEIPSN